MLCRPLQSISLTYEPYVILVITRRESIMSNNFGAIFFFP